MLEPIGIKEGEAEKVTVEGRIHEKASPLSDFGIHARVKIIMRSPWDDTRGCTIKQQLRCRIWYDHRYNVKREGAKTSTLTFDPDDPKGTRQRLERIAHDGEGRPVERMLRARVIDEPPLHLGQGLTLALRLQRLVKGNHEVAADPVVDGP